MNKLVVICACVALAACSHAPRTDAELESAAERAVDDELDAQGVFSEVQAVVAQDIACGHVVADVPSKGHVEHDFMYWNGRLTLDDDPEFAQAAMACDIAAGGGNVFAGSNDEH